MDEMRCRPWAVLAILALLPSGALAYNSTTDYNNVACVYPLSGTYGLLNRILFYLLWLVILFGNTWTWLALAASAWTMTYAATAAFHAFMLAVSCKGRQFDLDIVGSWAILSVATLWEPVISVVSTRLRASVYRPIFAVWGTIVAVGTICGIVSLWRGYPTERPCDPMDPSCVPACLNTAQIMRRPGEMEVMPAKRLFDGRLHALINAGVWMILVVIVINATPLACMFVTERKRTKSELERDIKYHTKNLSEINTGGISMSSEWGSGGDPADHWRDELKRATEELETGNWRPQFPRFFIFNPILIFLVIPFNEAYLLAGSSLPTSEPPQAVGQWSSWVTVVFALIAASINYYYEPRWKELKDIWAKEAEELQAKKAKKESEDPENLVQSGPGQSSGPPSDVEQSAAAATSVETTLPTPARPKSAIVKPPSAPPTCSGALRSASL